VNAVAFSPDGSLLASASYDETVRLWNPSTGQEVQELEGHTGWVNAVAFSPDGSLLASASSDQTVRLWDVSTSQQVQTLEELPGIITAISFSFDNTALLTNRGTISIDDKSIPYLALESSTGKHITIRQEWVRQGDYNLLWLPQEYRSGYLAFHGNTIAFGLNSGQVTFIQLSNLETSQCLKDCSQFLLEL
jgi:WD40 repeat protein